MKIDDDTVPNLFLITEFISYLQSNYNHLSNSYFCEIIHKAWVDRRPDGKYSITCDEYDRKYYNSYCCGVANLITSDLIPKLYGSTFNAKYFWVDDAYVGFITNSLDVEMIQINDYIVSDRERDRLKYERFLFFRDLETIEDILRIWELITKRYEFAFKMKKAIDMDFFEKII